MKLSLIIACHHLLASTECEGCLQVKGKENPVEVYSVIPRPNSLYAHGWLSLKPKANTAARRAPRQRRSKRSSVVIDAVLEAKSAAKIKPLIGRQTQLCEVITDSPRSTDHVSLKIEQN